MAARLTRRQLITSAASALVAGCASPYVTPGRVESPLSVSQGRIAQRDVRRYLPPDLQGTYFFGGGFLGNKQMEPQSVLVCLDADTGTLSRASYTYRIRRGQPLTDLGGAAARDVLDVVHEISGRVHKVVPLTAEGKIGLFPVAGAPAIVDQESFELADSFGDRAFYADNFSAHPYYDREDNALYYTRMDVIGNLSATLDGEPERYEHQLMRRDLQTGEETVVMSNIAGSIVHEVGRSPDGRLGVIVFTGDGIRFPLASLSRADLSRRSELTRHSSHLLVFDWATMTELARVPTASVPVHIAFDEGRDDQHVFVQCVNTTFVSAPPTTYGSGAYLKVRIPHDRSKPGVVSTFDDPKHCWVPHSMRLCSERVYSTNADSREIVGLDTEQLDLAEVIPFEPLSAGNDQHPRGIEASPDERFLIVSSNTSIHFYDRKAGRWAGDPIGVNIGERHAHSSRL